MKVFVTGGAGFVGRAVIEALFARGHSIHALVNHHPLVRTGDQIRSFPGGLFDYTALDAGMEGCDAIIHLVGIIAEKPAKGITFDRIHLQGTKEVVDAAMRAGITRYLHMSALGASPGAASNYHLTKFQAEVHVQTSDLDWTIFQPSLIHGPGGDFTKMEEGWTRGKTLPYLFMPYFNTGPLGRDAPKKIQPIYVEDIARAFAEALENPDTIDQAYPIGGADQLTWPQMHRIAAGVFVGHPRPTLAIPAWYAKAITYVVPRSLLPFTRDQVLMSQQDNVCDLTGFVEAFGWKPRGFEESLRGYVHE